MQIKIYSVGHGSELEVCFVGGIVEFSAKLPVPGREGWPARYSSTVVFVLPTFIHALVLHCLVDRDLTPVVFHACFLVFNIVWMLGILREGNLRRVFRFCLAVQPAMQREGNKSKKLTRVPK
jgi:hypothetical protein